MDLQQGDIPHKSISELNLDETIMTEDYERNMNANEGVTLRAAGHVTIRK
jgi:hypothetical protein